MGMSLLEIKKEIRSLPREQQRELTGDLIEEISAEDFPVNDGMLGEVNRRIEEYRSDPSKVATLDEIEARIRSRKDRA
jgi:putative addiction module component (TIGR02574 family)